MLEEGEILILSDSKKYVVTFSCIYQNDNYVFLVEELNVNNAFFCKYDNQNRLEEVIDKNLIDELLKIFKNS